MGRKWISAVLAGWVMMILPLAAHAEARFPQPDFQGGYLQPVTATPFPRALVLEYLDVAVLIAALCLASYLALRRRSRQWLVVLTIFSLLYFGFWRKGCICPIGSIQNVTLALSDSTYAIPIAVVAFFFLPLLFALFFGRTFCAAVCPLGAVQDLVAIRPIRLPRALAAALGIGPYLFLGLAVLLAACGAGFITCRHDPFVSFFRLSGSMPALVIGAAMLAVGLFIARPYCRFFCSYGVLLNWASRFARRHLTITPDECIRCRLCERACPYDAIQGPSSGQIPEGHEAGKRRLALLLVLFPVLILGGAWAGSRLNIPLERLNPTVKLAAEMRAIEKGATTGSASLELGAFLGSGRTTAELYRDAGVLRNRFRTGSWIFGAFVGLVVAGKLTALSITRRRRDYEPDRATCFSCGRCFLYCPREHQRLKKRAAEKMPVRCEEP